MSSLSPLAAEIDVDLRLKFNDGASSRRLSQWLGSPEDEINAALSELLGIGFVQMKAHAYTPTSLRDANSPSVLFRPQILTLIGEGKSNRQIGDQLHISPFVVQGVRYRTRAAGVAR